MSVADILRRIGKATDSSQLTKTVAEELSISDRQAYRRIRKAWKNKEIRRHIRQDRTVLYLLPEWPYSELEEKVAKALKKFKELEYRQVSLIDLAGEVGAPPNIIEALAYRLTRKYGLIIAKESNRRGKIWQYKNPKE